MLIPDSEVAGLRQWLIKKLEALEAVADEDVLADFVITLLRTDTPKVQLREDAARDLEDFLKDNTTTLLDDVFSAIETKPYIPGYKPPAAAPAPFASLPQPTRSSVPVDNGVLNQYNNLNGSRKRSFHESQGHVGGQDTHYARGDRQMKQMRRGARGRGGVNRGRGDHGQYDQSPANQAFPFPNAQLEGFPSLPFDPNDPFAAMAALQAMGLPGMPQFPPTSNSPFKKRCRDYDTIGYCAQGNTCPYQHGADRVEVPTQDEYDPNNAMLMDASPVASMANGNAHLRGRGRGRGQDSGRGRGERGGVNPRRPNRADFSSAGPNHDRSITSIVVEQIPEEKFEEAHVREFFSEFGNITEVKMQPYKRLAIVKYDDYFAARTAYDSPRVIFDNRFVKVYWYKPDSLPTPPNNSKNTSGSPSAATAEEQAFDREEFEKKSQEAQKKLEDKKAQVKEMEAKRLALEKQKAELAQKQADEKKRLLQRLGGRNGDADQDAQMTDAKANGDHKDESNVSASTKALRAKLAELEAEASSLGIDNTNGDTYPTRGRGRGRGRGSYRGWEGFAGRGAYDPYRGSPRGRGGFRGYGGGKYNLDLRTKKVGVAGVEWTSARDEALRQHLLGIGEFEAIEQHPDKSDTLIITFKDRQTAEGFIHGTKDVSQVGKLEYNWYNAPTAANTNTSMASVKGGALNGIDGNDGNDVAMDENPSNANADEHTRGVNGEVDYDVAEEDDRWN